MISVFRIEHRDTRVGVFQTPDPYTQHLATTAGNIGYLKAPSDDGIYMSKAPWNYVFGSESLDALKRWILLGESVEKNEAIVRELHARDFVLAEFLVEDEACIAGASRLQLLFDADTSRDDGLVEYRDIRELLSASPFVFCTSDQAVELH